VAFLYRLLPPRPTFHADMTAQEREVMALHGDYWRNLMERGVAVAFGPVLDEVPWGLGLLEVDDEAQARSIAATDPAVETGTCTYELVPMLQLVHRG